MSCQSAPASLLVYGLCCILSTYSCVHNNIRVMIKVTEAA
ncbi:unnamed protein product, partial [Staurois parvus]